MAHLRAKKPLFTEIKPMMNKKLEALAIATLGAIAGFMTLNHHPVEAAIISYDFDVAIDDNGTSIANQTFSGSFSFDRAQIPDSNFFGDDLFAIASFSFNFNGTNFNEADIFLGNAVFSGTEFLGLELDTDLFSFVPGDGDLFEPSFLYDLGNSDVGSGEVSYTQVPEPVISFSYLVVLGLGATSFKDRKNKM